MPIPSDYRRIEGSERRPARDAHLAGPADPNETLSVTIRLRRRPGSPEPPDMDYWAKTPPGKRHYLSRDEAAAQYGASQEDLDKVAGFAQSQGLKVVETSIARRSVVVSGSVTQMEKAFAVTLGRYESPTESYRGREDHIYIPVDLADIVEGVFGLDNRRMARRAKAPAGAAYLTPPQVAQLYNFPTTSTGTGQTIGLLEFGGGYVIDKKTGRPTDIDAFMSGLGLTTPTITPVTVDTGTNSPTSSDDQEVVLDIDVAASVAPGAAIAVYFAPWSEKGWVDAVTRAIYPNTGDPAPTVISVSWGWPELEKFGNLSWTQQAIDSVSKTFREAADQGIALFAASGDCGSDDAAGDGKAHADYPGSDPWVTCCGGTIITNVKGTSFTEGTWNDDTGATGGGISDVFDVPSWQAGIGLPKSANDGKHEGRGVPDVSGNASPYSGYNLQVDGNSIKGECGTSAVGPLYAALVARINDHIGDRVGYLNPTLYSLAGTNVLRDINDGAKNKWSGGPSNTPSYTCGAGWDACTGLGVVDGTNLQTALGMLLRKQCTLVTDRSTFGKGEIQAMLKGASGLAFIQAAFLVHVDGFRPDELGITSTTLSDPSSVAPTITPSPTVSGMHIAPVSFQPEDPTLPPEAQRFTWTYQVIFTDVSGFPATADGVTKVTLTATMGGVSDTGIIELIGEPNPYEMDGPIGYLSTDLRVFQITPGQHLDGLPGVVMPNTGNAAADASTFIKAVIDGFNKHAPQNHPFDLISTDEQTSRLELSQTVNGTPVFNFGVARVRYQDPAQDADSVRVFFRLFPALETSVAYDQSTTYRRGGQSGTVVPVLGVAGGTTVTIPCFAEPRVDSSTLSLDAQTDPANVQKTVHDAAGAEVDYYYGCWLDINQPVPQFPINPAPDVGPWSSGRKSVQELIRSAHQCLVSEIAYDLTPIDKNASPGDSDKLAQRNLAIVASANPGDADSHRIPYTFEIHPTSRDLLAGERPDELMFDWGNTPVGSLATIYLPGLNVADIIQQSEAMYGASRFSLVDDHTVQCRTGRAAWLPVPSGTGAGFVGLLGLDLPPTVKKGEVYKIAVRQLTNAAGQPPIVVELATSAGPPLKWRRVIGTFQVTIPVTTKDLMLDSEERLLSNLRWIEQSIPEGDRWAPAFRRYVGQIANHVDALGGDSTSIVASPSGEDVALLLSILNEQAQFFGGPVDIDVSHRTLESEPRYSFRHVEITNVFPVKNLRRFPQSDYIVTVTPSDWFQPESEFVTIPSSGTAALTFVFKPKAPPPPAPPADVTLCLKIVTPQGEFYNAPVDIDIKHRTLESAPRLEFRNVMVSGLIPVKGLRRFPQSDYVVTVTPSAVFHPESEFVTIPASGSANLQFVLTK